MHMPSALPTSYNIVVPGIVSILQKVHVEATLMLSLDVVNKKAPARARAKKGGKAASANLSIAQYVHNYYCSNSSHYTS